MTGDAPPTPLETLYDAAHCAPLPLPPALAALYGRLGFPAHPGRPYVVSNFVESLDGVVSLAIPGQEGGSEISGANPHDRMVMGLLRAAADAVVVGAGTLRASPNHLWVPGYVAPALAAAYQELRDRLAKTGPPLNVIVTVSGEIDLRLRVFQAEEIPTLIVTAPRGAERLTRQGLPPSTRVVTPDGAAPFSAAQIIDAVTAATGRPDPLILTEAGPHLMGTFLAERRLDELFLTLAPQIAGRDAALPRPGLVAGHLFAPDNPRWSTLASVRRASSHLFLRYVMGDRASRGP